MKGTKAQKGITLIALIITIVTLLILASVAISSIQNDGILSYTENVVNQYNQSQRDEQSVLDQYLDYLKGEQWVTIYEGPGTTVDGFVVIANKHLFESGRTYKITVESDEFSGTVETKAILAYSENGYQAYMLFGVTDGEAVTANSLPEYMTILQNMPEDAIFSNICGVNIVDPTDGNMSAIAKVESTSDCEYTVTKIEEKVEPEKEEDPSLIFEGGIIVGAVGAGGTELVGLKREMLLTKTYRLELLVNGIATTIYTQPTAFGYNIAALGSDLDNGIIAIIGNVVVLINGDNISCILTAIYEDGVADNYVEENGFEAIKSTSSDGWFLTKTPNTSYVVPETVDGKPITRVFLDLISGTPTFVNNVDIGIYDTYVQGREYKIVSTDLDVVGSLLEKLAVAPMGSIIDLTECGDELTFSDYVLENLTTRGNTLHVTSAVKTKYPDNTSIVVP